MTVTVLGIDLAKHVFQLCGIDQNGSVVVSKTLTRRRLTDEIVKINPTLIAFEAGSGAHHWARQLQFLGFKIKMMAPQYVRPFRKGASKDDRADALAIVEAALRPTVPEVAVKEVWQQDIQVIHRIRQDLVERRTALCNQYRSHLAEFGLTPAQGLSPLKEAVHAALDDGEQLPPMANRWLRNFLLQLARVEEDIDAATKEIETWAEQNEVCRRLMEIPGIAEISASALCAAFGQGSFLKNGRQAAAWIGLTPKRVGSGGKFRDLGISKQGDKYLRQLLIHGGRSLLMVARRKPERASLFVKRLAASKHMNLGAVAIANRNARLAWKLLRSGESYDPKRAGAI